MHVPLWKSSQLRYGVKYFISMQKVGSTYHKLFQMLNAHVKKKFNAQMVCCSQLECSLKFRQFPLVQTKWHQRMLYLGGCGAAAAFNLWLIRQGCCGHVDYAISRTFSIGSSICSTEPSKLLQSSFFKWEQSKVLSQCKGGIKLPLLIRHKSSSKFCMPLIINNIVL